MNSSLTLPAVIHVMQGRPLYLLSQSFLMNWGKDLSGLNDCKLSYSSWPWEVCDFETCTIPSFFFASQMQSYRLTSKVTHPLMWDLGQASLPDLCTMSTIAVTLLLWPRLSLSEAPFSLGLLCLALNDFQNKSTLTGTQGPYGLAFIF